MGFRNDSDAFWLFAAALAAVASGWGLGNNDSKDLHSKNRTTVNADLLALHLLIELCEPLDQGL